MYKINPMQTASKLTFLLSLLVLCQPLNSQNINVSAGINSTQMFVNKNDGYNNRGTYTSLKGFQLSITNEFTIDKILSIESGLCLFNRNYTYRFWEWEAPETIEKYNAYYIKIPVMLKLSFSTGQYSRFFINAGPYFSLGIAGNMESSGNLWYGIPGGTRKIKWGYGKEDDIKSMDTGLTFSTGFEYKSFQIIIGY